MADKPELPFDIESLQRRASSLRTAPVIEYSGDQETVTVKHNLVLLYERHGGDLDAIFMELGEDPTRAKTNPPSSAQDFADKYNGGFYA